MKLLQWKQSFIVAFSVPIFSILSACTHEKSLSKPCDVLVSIDPKPATNSYLVANDRETAVSIARHRGRFQQYGCGK